MVAIRSFITVTVLIAIYSVLSSALPYQQTEAGAVKPIYPYDPTTNVNNPNLIPADPTFAAIIGSSFLALANRYSDDDQTVTSTCNNIRDKLNAAVKAVNVCPWTYKCTYQENRYPRYILQAECSHNYEIKSVGTCNKDIPTLQQCKSIVIPDIPVLIEDNAGSGQETATDSNTTLPCPNGCHEERISISIGCKYDPYSLNAA